MIRWLGVLLVVIGCQSVQEKDAIFLKDRVEKLQPRAPWKTVRCEASATVSASQKAIYRNAFPDETALIDEGHVTYNWTAGLSKCQVHAENLTPMTANQRTLVEEALCTLTQVFWIHSPFDDLRILPTDMVDQDQILFIRQKPNSDVGLYLDKNAVRVETKTARKGTYSAVYEAHGAEWVPTELRHDTRDFKFVVKEFTWGSAEHAPPTSLWIYVGEKSEPTRHTKLDITCK